MKQITITKHGSGLEFESHGMPLEHSALVLLEAFLKVSMLVSEQHESDCETEEVIIIRAAMKGISEGTNDIIKKDKALKKMFTEEGGKSG